MRRMRPTKATPKLLLALVLEPSEQNAAHSSKPSRPADDLVQTAKAWGFYLGGCGIVNSREVCFMSDPYVRDGQLRICAAYVYPKQTDGVEELIINVKAVRLADEFLLPPDSK